MPQLVWVATANIYLGSGSSFALGYTPGNVVPPSVVADLDLTNSGLVQQATINDDGTSPNWRGTDPVTHSELGALLAAQPGAADASTTVKGIVQLAGDLGGTAAAPTVPGLAGKAATVHTHVATDISNSTAVGRSVLTATDAAAARTAISAGTSSLAIGTTGTTAKAGDYTPPDAAAATKGLIQLAGDLGGTAAAPTVPGLAGKAASAHTHVVTDLSNSTATGRSVLTAADAAAARTAIGAGTGSSNLALGTTSTTAKAGDYQPTAANISDSTATGRSVLTAASATAARTALGAGVVDSADSSVLQVVKLTQAAYDALGTKVATTLYVIVG